MKKYILIILITILIFGSTFGCMEKKNGEINTYKITIYKESEVFKLLDEDNQKTLDFLNKRYVIDKVYYAKEIISYTDKSIRFIDKNEDELFLTGDRVEIISLK